MEDLVVPPRLGEELGRAAADDLSMMFADAHQRATESFERRLDARLAEFNASVDRRLTTELGAFRLEMTKALGDLRFDLLKWSFLFWTTQLLAILGLLLRSG
jgi:hypothetical protein